MMFCKLSGRNSQPCQMLSEGHRQNYKLTAGFSNTDFICHLGKSPLGGVKVTKHDENVKERSEG